MPATETREHLFCTKPNLFVLAWIGALKANLLADRSAQVDLKVTDQFVFRCGV